MTRPAWRAEVLVPAHRIVLGILGDEVVEVRAGTGVGTFRTYRRLEGAVPGMIAWPNTVLLTGPENVIVDPGYQTQGDMLAGALAARGLTSDHVSTVVMTHLHSDHLSALPQLGAVRLHVHAAELETPWARRQRGTLDGVEVVSLDGESGTIREGLGWIHTPGHTPGHIAVVVDGADGRTLVVGDTLGPDPAWFATMDPPAGLEERDRHIASFRRIRALAPACVIPGHNPPFALSTEGAPGRNTPAER